MNTYIDPTIGWFGDYSHVTDSTLDWLTMWADAKTLQLRAAMQLKRARNAGPEARAKAAAQARAWREENSDHVKEYNKQYRISNIDKAREQDRIKYQRKRDKDPEVYRMKTAANMRKWRQAQGDEGKAKAASQMKQWREANSEHFHTYRAEYYKTNADIIKAAVKKWREDNHDEWLIQHRADQGRRRGAEGKFTKADISRLWEEQNGLCVYCPTELGLGLEIDHKTPISRGGSNWPANLQLLCVPCNRRKAAKTDEEFRSMLNA